MILIKKFNLLDFGLSGFKTQIESGWLPLINLLLQTPRFKVSGGRMPYNTSNGKAYARDFRYVLNHPIFSKKSKKELIA